MRTWICVIFGGGTPTYLISAEDERRAWKLVREALYKRYGKWYSMNEDRCSGLIEVDGWYSDEERIDDVAKLYTRNGTVIRGTFDGLKNY